MNKIELIKNLYKLFSDQDLPGLEKICSPKIKWIQNPGFPGGRISEGVESIIENVFEGNKARWDDFNFVADSFEEFETGVLVEGHYVVKSRESKTASYVQTAHIFRIDEEGKVFQFNQYSDTQSLWENLKPSLRSSK